VTQLILANLAMSRPFVAPPGVPTERMTALRDAFDATTKDPAFLAAAQKSGREISVYTAAQIDALLKDSYALPDSVVQRAPRFRRRASRQSGKLLPGGRTAYTRTHIGSR
jgi:hypothetical protein